VRKKFPPVESVHGDQDVGAIDNQLAERAFFIQRKIAVGSNK
jgi:hypothetical protein